jgi:transglutaminase-like putative cysteine protease
VIYNIHHRTIYKSSAPITFARCVLRLTPRSSREQTVFQSSVTVTPAPARTLTRTGPFGELVQTMVVEKPAASLVIDAKSRVDVHTAPMESLFAGPAWETIRARSLETPDIGTESPASYLYPTARTPILPQVTDYGRESFWQGRPIVEAASELMRRMRDDFVYDSEATTVATPIAEAFSIRHGVCQDFTQIMIAALRGLGLPAAYVSGYLRTIPPPGKPRLEGADATHAWVRVWCGPDDGWIGFDPTNAILARDDHITLAIGRDYADIAPVDCIILSAGEQELDVEVDVVPADEPALHVASTSGR